MGERAKKRKKKRKEEIGCFGWYGHLIFHLLVKHFIASGDCFIIILSRRRL
jgi:hypothetical protein